MLQREISPPPNYPAGRRHFWVSSKNISPQMKLAVIAAEDQLFTSHWGFDFKSLKQAIEENMQGGRLRGASTLTQQTAKNLYLWGDKSLFRKAIEAYLTILIELLWDKQRILEVYLNIIEFGPGIYGVEAASREYFRKNAAQLSSAEAALLAAVLPNPYRLRVDKPSDYVRKRSQWIKQQMGSLSLENLR